MESRTPTLGQGGSPLVGKGLPSCWGCDPRPRGGEHSPGRGGGRRPRLPGGARGAGLRLATRGIHLPGPARRFLTQRGGGGGGEGHGRLRRPPLESPAPPRRVPCSPLGRRRPHLACWAPGGAGRGRAGNFAAAGGAAPPGASASVRVTEGLLRAAAERGTRRKVAWASGGPGGRGPSRSRLGRSQLQRGCAQDASDRRSSRPPVGSGIGFRAAIPSACPGGGSSLCRRKSSGRGGSSILVRAGPLSAGAGGWSRRGRSRRPRGARF